MTESLGYLLGITFFPRVPHSHSEVERTYCVYVSDVYINETGRFSFTIGLFEF